MRVLYTVMHHLVLYSVKQIDNSTALILICNLIHCYFMTCRLFSLSITRNQELQQPDFYIAIWSVHRGINQLGPPDKATCELQMSFSTNTSYLNNPFSVKAGRSISECCQDIFPERSTFAIEKKEVQSRVNKLVCLWCCLTSWLDPPLNWKKAFC